MKVSRMAGLKPGFSTALIVAAVLGAFAGAKSASAQESLPQGVIRLDETVISGNQELPKVLYILPWRDPEGLPDIELKTDFTELDVFRRLYPPAYRRELSYFGSLETANSEKVRRPRKNVREQRK